jgi:hypothetical protein
MMMASSSSGVSCCYKARSPSGGEKRCGILSVFNESVEVFSFLFRREREKGRE